VPLGELLAERLLAFINAGDLTKSFNTSWQQVIEWKAAPSQTNSGEVLYF
jgi:hypothetical protein